MSIRFNITKLVVHDLEACERFYVAIGFKVFERRVGPQAIGENEVAQEQVRLSETGDAASSHVLVLSRFPNFPPPSRPVYPGESWLVIHDSNVAETVMAAHNAGGRIVRPSQDRPEHGVRAAIVADPAGHIIELYGPLA